MQKQLLVSTLSLIFSMTSFADQSVKFSPYVDLTVNVQWNTMEPMDLLSISQTTGLKYYHLAFITDAGNCTAAWGAQPTLSVASAWGSHLTNSLREHSVNYVISLGGASGDDLSKACTQTQLVNEYDKIIRTYQPQGLDFDIENGSADVTKIMTSLKQIQSVHHDLELSFTLPVLPEGLTYTGEEIVKLAIAANLNFKVNIMAMDYGPAYANDMGEYAVMAANKLYQFLKSMYPAKSDSDIWDMIQVTPMIGVNDVNSEQFTLRNVDTLKNFAKINHLNTLSIWSVARDMPCADKWASPICSGNNLQTEKYEYIKRFITL